MKRLWLMLLCCSAIGSAGPLSAAEKSADAKPKFELRDGDRVVFLGNTLIERAQKFGYWETMLTARYPDRNIVFRNLGWDGDTVWADSRGIFDTPAKGYQKMLEHVGKIKPTVIFLGYGNNEAFAGEKGLPAFIKQYGKLIDDLTKASAKGVRFVVLLPVYQEKMPPPLPDPARYNQMLEQYENAIIALAAKRGFPTLNPVMFRRELEENDIRLTLDGMHLSPEGYQKTNTHLQWQLNQIDSRKRPASPLLFIAATGKAHDHDGFETVKVEATKTGVRFRTRRITLAEPELFLVVRKLPAGRYVLNIDGNAVRTDSAAGWAEAKGGQNIGPDFAQFEKLRKAVIEKNLLYFYHWRPQNVTYLFLFRKHEQGNNAKEIEEFKKLVAEKEKEIARLKKPVMRSYELMRVKEK